MRSHDREASEGRCGFDDSNPENRRGNGLKGCVDNNLQVWMT